MSTEKKEKKKKAGGWVGAREGEREEEKTGKCYNRSSKFSVKRGV